MPVRRPGTGAALGVIIGLAVAVLLQQQGVWPLDKITVFLLPAATGIIGIIVTSVGRSGSAVSLTISVIVVGAAAAYGATGLGDIDEKGELKGGCVVTANSGIDATMVTDTSRGDPFMVDPNGSLSWTARSSPNVFMDYDWEIWVEFGGFQVVWDSDHEDNEGGSEFNRGDVPNVGDEAEARGIDITTYLGIYKVGGFASICNGFGFVKLIAEPLETLASKIALAIAIAALIALLIVALRGRGGGPGEVPVGPDDAGGDVVPGAGAGVAPGGDGEDEDEIFEDGFESGDTSEWGPADTRGEEDLPKRDDLA